MSSHLAAGAAVARPESQALAAVPACAGPHPVAHAHEAHGVIVASAKPILVVEADSVIAKTLVEQLTRDGYRAEPARTAEHARVRARWNPPRLVLLGRLNCSRGALELLEEIRKRTHGKPTWAPAVPVIVLGASLSELEVLRAFEAGADDFARPAGYLELRARIRALLQRAESRPPPQDRLVVGPLEIDMSRHAAYMSGAPVRLRRLEFELLAHLAAEPDRVFAKHELLRAVWGYRSTGSTRTVDSHASRLRRKLEQHGERWVINEWGVGYRLR